MEGCLSIREEDWLYCYMLTYSLVYVVSAVWTNCAEPLQKADLVDVEEGVKGFTTLEPS